MDLKKFYYGTPMARYEYMKMHLSLFPDKIILQYKLRDLADSKGILHGDPKGPPWPQAGWAHRQQPPH
jgi:hypothetical protein